MRRIFLIVAMLLPVTSALAGVTIWVDQNDGLIDRNGVSHRICQVRYSGEDVNVRAFALNLVTDNGMPLDLIRDFNRGESNNVAKGYGIFPGRFRDFINPAGPNWADANYHPGTPWNSPGAMGATLDSNWVVVELGTLFKGEPNRPNRSGMLFRIDVNSEGGSDCNMTISLEDMRGGLVGDDGNPVATLGLPYTTKIQFLTPPLPPATLTYPAADYNGFYQVSWSASAYATTYQLDRNFNGGGWASIYSGANTSLNEASLAIGLYRYRVNASNAAGTSDWTTGAYDCNVQVVLAPSWFKYPIYDPDCNIPILWSASAEASNYELDYSTNGGGAWTTKYSGSLLSNGHMGVAPGNYRYRVRASNVQFGASAYNTGTFDCRAILSTCYKFPDANYQTNWVAVGRPDCWCRATTANEPNGSGYQCDGDADGGVSAGMRIYGADLTMLSNNWKKKNNDLTSDPNVTMTGKLKIQAACADFGHTVSAGMRIYGNDLTILSTNWKKKSSSTAVGTQYLPGNCPR